MKREKKGRSGGEKDFVSGCFLGSIVGGGGDGDGGEVCS